MNFYMKNPMDYMVLFIMAILVIIGIYQFYFWCQRNNRRVPIEMKCFVDDWFTLKPAWIWIYSGIYYPVIVFMIFSFRDMRHFNYTCISFFVLLMVQMIFFIFLPVKTPDSWRNLVPGNSITHRFMRYVQTLDQSNNCFPSMHISVSTLTAMHLQMNIAGVGSWIYFFPVLIGVSAMYTKQHFFLDLAPGAVVGYGAFKVFELMYI